MKFKIDENMPVETADLLRRASYEADTVYDEQVAGYIDPLIAQICLQENRILITLDLDFSDIRHYPPDEYPGIIVLRPAVQSKPAILKLVHRLVGLIANQSVEKQLWVVDESGVRIRGKDESQ